MADPYYRYGALPDRGVYNHPGYLSSSAEAPHLASSNHINDFRDSASDFLRREITPLRQPVSYGLNNSNNDDIPVRSGVIPGASSRGYLSPLNDPSLPSHRLRDTSVNVTTLAIPDVINDQPPNYLRINADSPSVSRTESNILFVDGLPTDCTRREVGHLFRPFIGYKDIKVIHREPRRDGDKAMVYCFVEFADAKCAITAMEALQGYKFDDRRSNSPVLRIHLARFPFRPPHDRNEQPVAIPR
ncbi:RNA-binding protein 2 [Ricinus communis]|uniref:RRM domain-containing protein n=1 Tax=Ricinus communis TaxID=3988 RepID=B9RQS9_RICCO|nr:RNA-binding protein 2 [Ricinus communis]EEF46100.1 conserved hypothetical protein [Ricinus communis]|eukprot:XP_002516098.1 RNA-binding protein 2 [Ricinus communis]